MSGSRTTRRTEHGFKRRSAIQPGARAVFKVRGVDGWRGIACLIIVVCHTWQAMDTNNDGYGPGWGRTWPTDLILSMDVVVDLFFVLTGLLLFLPFAHAALAPEAPVPTRRDFLWRRMVRLIPVYWFLVLIAWSLHNFGAGTAQWRDLGEHLLLVQAFDSERIFFTIGPAWTLSVDWVFYLAIAALCPPLVRWARGGSTEAARVTRLVGALSAVGAMSVLYKLNVQWVWQIPVESWAWRFGPAAKADDVVLGALLAVAMVALRGRELPVLPSIAVALAGCWLIYLGRHPGMRDPDELVPILRHPIAASGWCLVLLVVMACRSPRPARWVDNRLFLRISVLAYTIYLVHETLIFCLKSVGLLSLDPSDYGLNLALAIAVTIAGAWVVHRVIEEPWADLLALQSKGGGRRDLYPHLTTPVSRPHVVPIDRPSAVREAILAREGGGPVLLVGAPA